jgi:hypothetical protein
LSLHKKENVMKIFLIGVAVIALALWGAVSAARYLDRQQKNSQPQEETISP